MSEFTSDIADKTSWKKRNAQFAGALLDPGTDIPEGTGNKGRPAPKRFSVYRNNVVASLMDNLKSAYPSLLAIMGTDNFTRVARNYVAMCPPKSPMMQNFGDDFADFIAGFKPLAKSPFLVEVARAERYWIECHHAMDADVLTAEELRGIEPEKSLKLVFEPHPALRLIVSSHALFDLFNARNVWPLQGFELDNPQSVLFTRPLLQTMAIGIDPAITRFFMQLIEGSNLGEAIGAVLQQASDFDPAAAISLMLESGAFTKIITTEKL